MRAKEFTSEAKYGFFGTDNPKIGDRVEHVNGATGIISKISTQGDETWVYFKNEKDVPLGKVGDWMTGKLGSSIKVLKVSEADMSRREFLKRAAATTAAAAGVGSAEADHDSEEARIAADPNWMPLYKDGEPVTNPPYAQELYGKGYPKDTDYRPVDPTDSFEKDPDVQRFYDLKAKRCLANRGTPVKDAQGNIDCTQVRGKASQTW